tara:strand:+ start:76 stop:999 length:924 start_codon:yes stop_codon:yes gene_type:complete
MGSEDMKKEYERIVMDAANVIRDDTGIEIKNDDGQSLSQVRPERLRDAIQFCERKGWETIAFLQERTYKMALKLKNVDPKRVGDLEILDDLIEQGKVELVKAKSDDIFYIDYALEENAIIVTNDTFKDKRDGTKRERSLYPDRPWDDIDRRTVRGFRFMNGKFIFPDLPVKSIPQKQDKTVSNKDILTVLLDIQTSLRKLQLSGLKTAIESPKSQSQQKNSDREIVSTLVNEMLRKNDTVALSLIQTEIARVLLGLKGEHPDWKKGWGDQLRKRAGYSKTSGFGNWLLKNMDSKIKINQKTQRVSLA